MDKRELLKNLDALCSRLQADYNGDKPFEQYEEDRTAVYDTIEYLENLWKDELRELDNLDELKMETQSRYDDYLMATENRGASYGEIAYIQSLSRKELDEFCEELENETAKGVKNDKRSR